MNPAKIHLTEKIAVRLATEFRPQVVGVLVDERTRPLICQIVIAPYYAPKVLVATFDIQGQTTDRAIDRIVTYCTQELKRG